MKKQIRNLWLLMLLVNILMVGCKTDPFLDSTKFSLVNSENGVLKAYGIYNFLMYTNSPDNLYLKVGAGSNEVNITSKVNADANTQDLTYQSEILNFSLNVNFKTHSFKFKSSKGDDVEIKVENRKIINVRTGEELPTNWYRNLKVEYSEVAKMMEAIADVEKAGKYKSSIQIKKEQLAKQNFLKIATSMSTKGNPQDRINYIAPCKQGEICIGDSHYNLTQTTACEDTQNTLGGNCSNQYCIGACVNLGCDCVCVLGDYLCVCTAKGRYCARPDIIIGPIP